MKRSILTSAALLLSLSSVAMAQTATTTPPKVTSTPVTSTPTASLSSIVAPNPSATAASSAGGMFASVLAKDDLSLQLVGLDLYNNARQDIGTIKDIAFDQNGVKAYIVGVGGFLGMGDRYVAVRPSAVTLSYDATEKKWHAVMDTNADQLKAAPEFKYPSNS